MCQKTCFERRTIESAPMEKEVNLLIRAIGLIGKALFVNIA